MARTDRLDFLKAVTEEEVKKICETFLQYRKDGNKINSIKRLREFLSLGLVEAKDLIEAMEEIGMDEVLNMFRPKADRDFRSYRRIFLEEILPEERLHICPICSRPPVEEVKVIASSGITKGVFCEKCYDYLVSTDILLQVKRKIDRITEFVEHLKREKK